MLVTALAPVIATTRHRRSRTTRWTHDLTLKAAALKLGFVTAEDLRPDRRSTKMVKPYVASRQ